MTPLHQLVDALLESTDPVFSIIDDVDLAPDARGALSAILAPLEQLYQPQDLLVATAVLEAVAPLLHQTEMLLAAPPSGRPV
ncbi:hypothetical protein [Solirubrobacter soli]|uniref:hypothetical protein n=1 Tax=Solirubrobacter soli TaxID=363832 RepID=UPI0003FA2CD4|nr:hypothetical protein [Solirubrobacter soli]